jgi:agmatinase
MPFQMNRNFCGVSPFEDQPLAVVGIPFDGATSFRSGARMAPAAIRDASLMLTDGCHELWPVSLNDAVGDAGDWPIPNSDSQAAVTEIERCHRHLVQQGCHLVCLGGDHLVTLGILRSLYQQHGPMAVIHFDAHCDTWADHFGEPLGHGTWLRNAVEEGLVHAPNSISIGLRSPVDACTRAWFADQKGLSISARNAMNTPVNIMSDMISCQVGRDLPIYVSLDIDCLDPSFAPGTGTPEIGGLTTAWLSHLLDLLFANANLQRRWTGMDIVEVAPSYDHSSITALAAATFAWQYLSMQSSLRSKIRA